MIRHAAIMGAIALLAACSSTPSVPPQRVTVDGQNGPISKSKTPTRKPSAVLKKGGGFYKDDGPGDEIPDGLDDIADAEPQWEPLHKPATRPYVVLGKAYTPNTQIKPYKARGIASWYGKKFHGQKTSIGEPYNMFAMTAAHTTLALPSYARVTSVQSGESVIVRVIDRGPFHADRIIDLSYTAAYKLGLINGGSGLVEVEAIIPGDPTASTYAQVKPPLPAASESDPLEQLAQRMAEEASAEQRPLALVASTASTTNAANAANLANSGRNASEPTSSGIYLQLGAFANLDNAENFKSRLSRELDWLPEPMRLQVAAGMHRLQLGPYASRAEAEQMAEKIRAALGFKPSLVVR